MLKHFFTNSFGILFSRILGFLRDMLTAAILGASVWSDIFFIAFKLPNLFRRLFGEGAFTQAFLPNFVSTNKKGLFSIEILLKFLCFILLLSLTVMLFAPLFTKALAIGFDENMINLAVPLVKINFWYLSFIFLVTLFASMLQYKGHFATTAFSTALLNISMICALLLSYGNDQKTAAYYLSYGVVIGGFLQMLTHIIALKHIKMLRILQGGFIKFKKGLRAKTDGFWKNFYHGVIGSSSAQIGAFMDTWFASFLATGSISYLYYANRIFQLPYSLFAVALTTAVFPKISRQIKANSYENALNLMSKSFHFLLAFLLFSSIGGIMLSYEITWLLFERGEFNSQNTKECAQVLSMFMIGLIAFGLAKLFSLWLYAKMQQKLAAKISIYSLLINLVFCLLLIKPLGAAGLALASSISAFYLLFMNIKIFSFNNFLAIISAKKILIIFALCVLEILILLVFKGFIDGYIR
ncbi:MAG: murein biosynthesis integral membrane protein MurJ [Campylobacter sputorum]|uniref:murein biosynthesis integral membrane protein MurJ n=1 Tax=Campylobacter sputorum TaxID=206 RepID=UPI000B77C19D|nr:murein biosynthesis integral membrane protein MurJ [Campylobacter sputorum]ASM37029.1 lipid II flippase [Campylobacter sputorum bv. faecalis CCUG 20703]ASM38695.1 lipid II flippase [Campylobacter sputorum bv. paraureolyticus LMG 11764]MDY6120653.1 murein biosynthesis integral membrane protein MurJ [Campylobacter sputorum]